MVLTGKDILHPIQKRVLYIVVLHTGLKIQHGVACFTLPLVPICPTINEILGPGKQVTIHAWCAPLSAFRQSRCPVSGLSAALQDFTRGPRVLQDAKNVDGDLYSLIYGRVSSFRVSPIEIKPLFHFYPGSRWLSLGGCPRMPFCPNSSSCPKKLSSEYQLYACGNFFGHSSILNKIAILGQPPRDSHRLPG